SLAAASGRISQKLTSSMAPAAKANEPASRRGEWSRRSRASPAPARVASPAREASRKANSSGDIRTAPVATESQYNNGSRQLSIPIFRGAGGDRPRRRLSQKMRRRGQSRSGTAPMPTAPADRMSAPLTVLVQQVEILVVDRGDALARVAAVLIYQGVQDVLRMAVAAVDARRPMKLDEPGPARAHDAGDAALAAGVAFQHLQADGRAEERLQRVHRRAPAVDARDRLD